MTVRKLSCQKIATFEAGPKDVPVDVYKITGNIFLFEVIHPEEEIVIGRGVYKATNYKEAKKKFIQSELY